MVILALVRVLLYQGVRIAAISLSLVDSRCARKACCARRIALFEGPVADHAGYLIGNQVFQPFALDLENVFIHEQSVGGEEKSCSYSPPDFRASFGYSLAA